MSSRFDYRLARPTTAELCDLAEQGVISWENLARDMMNWVSEQEVHRMAEENGYIVYEDD